MWMLTGFDMIMGSDHEKKGQNLPGRTNKNTGRMILFFAVIAFAKQKTI